MLHSIVIYYFIAGLLSLIIAIFVSSKLIQNKGESSPIAKLITWFSGIGIGFAVFGILFLMIHALFEPYKDNHWDLEQISGNKALITKLNLSQDINLSSLNSSAKNIDTTLENSFKKAEFKSALDDTLTVKKQDDFDIKTFSFNQNTTGTASTIFTIAGICLGALGVFWLGYLESNRLPSARQHDQQVQNDNVRSLLAYAESLLIKIDEKLLNFKTEYDKKDLLYEKIETNISDKIKKGEKIEINLFDLEQFIHNDPDIKYEFEKQVVLSYHYLFDRAVSSKKTLLEEVERIVVLIDQFMLEKDFKLFDDIKSNSSAIRDAMINLVESYMSYTNTLKGIDNNVELTKKALHTTRLDFQKLLINNDTKQTTTLNPIKYLSELYNDTNVEDIFYERFTRLYSYDFTSKYLLQSQELLNYYECEELSNMFILMDYTHMDVRNFFLAYFEKIFFVQIEKMSRYKSMDLKQGGDLGFEVYLELIESTLKAIKAEKRSLSKLFSLYKALSELKAIIPIKANINE